MTIQMVLLPVFVQVALTFALLIWMASARTGEHQARRDQDPRHRARPAGLARQAARRSATATTASSRFRCCSMCWSILALDHQAGRPDLRRDGLDLRAVARSRTPISTPPRTTCRRASRSSRSACSCCCVMWIIFAVRILISCMTPSARLSAAIEVLADIEARRRPAAQALKDWGLSHRFAGSGDRAAIAGLVYDALRRKASSAWIMGADTPRAVLLGMLRARARARCRSDREAVRRRALRARAADRRRARAPARREPRRRAAACASATIPNGSTPISPRRSATSAPRRARRWPRARRSICASTR